jgi:AraC-like DNA-binding protein
MKGSMAVTDEAVWRTSSISDTGLLRARYVRQTFPRHFHETFVVCVNERGAHGSWYRGANLIIPQGAVTVVLPGEVHTGQPVPGWPWHYRAIYPSVALLTELAGNIGFPPTQVPSFPSLWLNDAVLTRAFLRAHRAHEEDADPLVAEGGVLEVLAALVRRHALGRRSGAGQQPPDGAARRAVEYLNDCFADRITLDHLARALGLTKYFVLRAFRRATGMPPYAYLTQIRVERAKKLLYANLPIAAVARRVGFADQSHLTRHFRRLVGVTPGVFARGARTA